MLEGEALQGDAAPASADGHVSQADAETVPPASPQQTAVPSPPDSAILALARYQLEQRARRLPEDAITPAAR